MSWRPLRGSLVQFPQVPPKDCVDILSYQELGSWGICSSVAFLNGWPEGTNSAALLVCFIQELKLLSGPENAFRQGDADGLERTQKWPQYCTVLSVKRWNLFLHPVYLDWSLGDRMQRLQVYGRSWPGPQETLQCLLLLLNLYCHNMHKARLLSVPFCLLQSLPAALDSSLQHFID